MQQQFAQHGIEPVQRFAACDGETLKKPDGWAHSAGAYGCLLSHVEVVKDAQRSGASSVLIFEDDTVLDPEFQNQFASFMQEVPADWDMLYFGALHKDEPIKISEHVGRITKANSTYAYALKNTVFDEFISLNTRAEQVLDMNSYLLQEQFNCYCFLPNLAWVETAYSDVQDRLERHWYLEKSLVLFGAQVDRLLSKTAIIIAHSDAGDSKNLEFLARYYDDYFKPFIEIVIVEANAASFNLETCFNDGIARASRERELLILLESDIYLETMDLRANLRMCEQFDAVTGFDEVIELTAGQAKHLRETGLTRGINVSRNPLSKNKSIRFLNRRVLEAAGGWREHGPLETESVFQSPNHALRLPSD
jgi:glycosyl transferase family 25